MSGWRSGSGRRGDWLDAAVAAPQSLAGADPVAGAGNRMFWILCIGLLVVVAISGAYQASLRPPHRILPAPIHGSVLVVPIGEFPRERLSTLASDYGDEYGLTVSVAEPITLDPLAWNATRQQFIAQGLIDSLRRVAERLPASADQPLIIGVTQADLYIDGIDWRWAFALRLDERFGIISTARMPNTKSVRRWDLFRKMLTRQLGFLAWHLPPTDDPYDLLYREILSADDLARLSGHL
jgi:predicted Zn-dependent protease